MNRISEKEARLDQAAAKIKKGMPRHERRLFVTALVAFRNGLEIECMKGKLGPPITFEHMKAAIANELKGWTREQLEEHVAEQETKLYAHQITPVAFRLKAMGVKNVREVLDKMIERAEQLL